ncbi:MAG: CcdB family protein [Pseudomonadales bacterium]|nr:CcdB family protein [Pseudomonadales bacterium]
MPQFTAYQNKNAQTKKLIPFLLDVQTELLDELQTRVVVPLTSAEKNVAQQMSRLTPLLKIDGENYLMLTPQLAGINKKELGKPVADLSSSRTEIIVALDFLVTGF